MWPQSRVAEREAIMTPHNRTVRGPMSAVAHLPAGDTSPAVRSLGHSIKAYGLASIMVLVTASALLAVFFTTR